MKQHGNQLFGLRLRRLLSSLLCAAVLCGLLPEGVSLAGTARAAEVQLAWSDEDLETLRSYDIMRGDEGGMRPNDTIRRSEFAAMVNRALGYTERAGKNPFKDVTDKDWFFDDISISYNMGYLNGTSPTTVSPNGTLTREEALVILGRNLMLQPKAGESFSFADSRTFSSWSRGYLDPAVEAGIIDADSTGNFTPKKIITRGELAGMVVRAIGTPIQTPGVKNLDTVNGNVTITASGVTLRNTTINGDLYLTGGIGLGDVLLDNVTVNGRIVDSGAGLSEKGEISVALNNVTADELIVDSMRNQTISLSARGRTLIPKTSIRTPARVEDSTAADYGLRLIEIDGEDKTAVTLSGNIKEVHNKTPGSSLNIGEGVAEKVTVDEAAVDSTVTVGKDARIKYLNLDAGVKVSGSGSVDSLTVSANGATVTLPQAPDEIIIAPGITATINKQKMDTAAALEASSRPRLMPGYPEIQDLAPTSATALFKTNKPSTVYWAVTALADGSPSEEEIISPPSYAKKILKSGSVKVKESNKEYTAKISGLTSDGSYYLSTIVMDDKGSRSTMKVAAFTTPDNTTPAFSKGYPAEHEISEQNAQFAVMTTKSCNLYYALLPKGSTAPRAADFKAGSISGNLGYGVVKMEKNNPAYIFVNDVTLEEQKEYVLYLWLNDFDGAKSSAVKAMNFTTQDKTDPVVSNMRDIGSKNATTANASFSVSEAATLYWAVVVQGDKNFMTPAPGFNNETWPNAKEAMERVIAGTGAIKSGKTSVAANKAGADVSLTVSGLNSSKTGTSAYDLYYVAVDKAGNWSKPISSVTVYTKDTTKPTVEQQFTSFTGEDNANTTKPLADTDVQLVFSKQVGATDVDGDGTFYSFLELYQRKDYDKLADLLKKYVKFYEVQNNKAVEQTNNRDVIRYENVKVSLDSDNSLVVEFPNAADDPSGGALTLGNGRTYYFVVSPKKGNIRDTTTSRNEMDPKTLPRFTTMPAQVGIGEAQGVGGTITVGSNPNVKVDFAFELDPTTTNTSPADTCYDIMLWSDTSLTFNVYMRKKTGNGPWSGWEPVAGTSGAFKYIVSKGTSQYITIQNAIRKANSTDLTYNPLNQMGDDTTYQYAVNIIADGAEETDRDKWNITAKFGVSIASGTAGRLYNVTNSNAPTTAVLDKPPAGVSMISSPKLFEMDISITDAVAPILTGTYPHINSRDVSATIDVALDRTGRIYYLVTPCEYADEAETTVSNFPVQATLKDGTQIHPAMKPTDGVPEGNTTIIHGLGPTSGEAILSAPGANGIISNQSSHADVRTGSKWFDGVSAEPINLTNLKADTWYYVYLMFQGNETSEYAVCYKFKTAKPERPILNLVADANANGTVYAEVNNTSGDVTAQFIPQINLDGTILNEKFNNTATHSAEFSSITTWVDESVTGHGAYSNLTILQAMSRASNGSGTNSVFDKYASKELQEYMSSAIRDGSIPNIVGKWGEPTRISMGDSRAMPFKPTDVDLIYVCVAVAENVTPGGLHSFKAHENVRIVDKTNPIVETISGPMYVNEEKTGDVVTGYKLIGSLTLDFPMDLYVSTGTKRYPLALYNGTVATDSEGKEWHGFQGLYSGSSFTIQPGDGCTLSADGKTVTGATKTKSFTVDIEYPLGSSMPNSQTGYIAIPRGLCNQNGDSAGTQRIQYTIKKSGDGYEVQYKVVNK